MEHRMVPITQPMLVFDEKRAINRMAIMVNKVLPKLEMRRDEVREWLRTLLRERLRRGLTDRQLVVDAAWAGCKLSHDVVMTEFHELLDVNEMPPASLRAYAARAGERRFKPGSPWYEDFIRNLGFCILICVAGREFEQFGLNPTRNREQRRTRQPSWCSLVRAGLERNGIHLGEKTLENLWGGVYGQLVRQQAMAAEGSSPTLIP
jgi:hypothetical protein